MRIWDAVEERPIATAAALEWSELDSSGQRTNYIDGLRAVAMTADGRTVAAGSRKIAIWDADTGSLRATVPELDSYVSQLAFSPDGSRIASTEAEAHSTNDRPYSYWHVNLWNAQTGARIFALGQLERKGPLGGDTWPLESDPPVAFSADGRYIAAGHEDKVKIWNATDGKLITTLRGHTEFVHSVTFSTGDTQILSGSADGTVKTWDWKNGRVLATTSGAQTRLAFSPDAKFAAITDGNLCLVRLADGERLCLLRQTKSEGNASLAYTPTGLFAGEGEILDKVRFRVGGISTGVLLTADQLFERYYRQSLVADYFAGKPLEAPAANERGVGLPPDVRFGDVPARTTKRELELPVTALNRGGGVSEIRVYVNGSRVEVGRARGLRLEPKERAERPDGSVDAFVKVLLSPGENEIIAEAYNVAGKVRSHKARTLVKLDGHDVRAPKLHLVVTALDQYVDPTQTLAFPTRDAAAVIAAFEAQKGRLFRDVRTQLLTNQKVTKRSVAEVLGSLAGETAPEDVLLVYAAGHGVALTCDGETRAHYRFLGYDASLRSLPTICEHGFSDDWLAALIRRVPVRKKVVVLDTCQAGSAATEHMLIGMRGAPEIEAVRRLARAEGMAVIAAAQANEYALEVGSLGHGLFTHALLEGLGGKAALRGSQSVTVAGLLSYVADRVPELSRMYTDRPQFPIVSHQGNDFPIAFAGAEQ